MSHQTVRLASGRHRRPDDGVCVMELAAGMTEWIGLRARIAADGTKVAASAYDGAIRSYEQIAGSG